jgi:hypothetical protein
MRNRHEFRENYWVVPETRLDTLLTDLKKEFPELIICLKNDVWWHWVIHVLICVITLFFNRRYMGGFTTTTPNRIALSDDYYRKLKIIGPSDNPSLCDYDEIWVTLSHERQHLRDFRDWGFFKMAWMYLIPPFFFAWGRTKIELRAYAVTLACDFQLNREFVESVKYKNWWVNQFTSAGYAWMWVLKSDVCSWFDDNLKSLQEEAVDGDVRPG